MFRHKSSPPCRFCITSGAASRAELVAVPGTIGSALNRTGDNMTTLTSRLRAGVLGMALAGGVTAWPAYACAEERNEGSKQSDIGAVTGLAVGAAAGGPLGAVLGAAAGALLGDRYHRQARARIAGYADPRGSDAYNDELSLRRAQAVAAVLMSAGVPGERILIEAHGKTESTSAAGDLDAYALERRVTVRVELQGSARV